MIFAVCGRISYARTDEAEGVALLVLVQARGEESPQLVEPDR
jgi:hypothetical protein